MQDYVCSLLFPRQELIVLEELAILIQDLEILESMFDVLRVQVEVAIFVEDADVEVQTWPHLVVDCLAVLACHRNVGDRVGLLLTGPEGSRRVVLIFELFYRVIAVLIGVISSLAQNITHSDDLIWVLGVAVGIQGQVRLNVEALDRQQDHPEIVERNV